MKKTLKSITIVQDTGETPMLMRRYRVWLEDSVEPEGGTWWHCYSDAHGYLRQEGYDHPVDELDTLDQYIQWGYKIEEI